MANEQTFLQQMQAEADKQRKILAGLTESKKLNKQEKSDIIDGRLAYAAMNENISKEEGEALIASSKSFTAELEALAEKEA